MSYDDIAAEREQLIEQGVDLPNLEDQYYNPDDKFDTFSCATGDYRAQSKSSDIEDSITIKVESDIDDYSTDTETLCDDSEYTSQGPYSTLSTITTAKSQAGLNGNEPVVIGGVGVNDTHEGMSYDLLADGLEAYEYNENILQTGNLYLLSFKNS